MTDRNYREDFPLLRNNDTAYIDNAATAQKPQVVIDAEREFYEKRMRIHSEDSIRSALRRQRSMRVPER